MRYNTSPFLYSMNIRRTRTFRHSMVLELLVATQHYTNRQ